ncbi:hypothetical protein CVT24_012306 [Panaeolus cyanescens]|uniref:SCP domain-containing protein n=1 Tax=Panaeolus cyanescens TaxID=181874 RepID=A0A409YJ68_9AGAR|nr:hypothetical protein CVT24_012306 [Panaeolus cyanescens]
MQLFSLVALLPLLSNVALAAPSSTDGSTFTGPHPISSSSAHRVLNITSNTVSTNDRAGGCYTTNYNINREDMTALSADLQNNNPQSLTYLPANHWISYRYGTALLCLFNDYVFENTHLSRWEAGWAIKNIQETCSYTGSGICQGGFTTCHGESEAG